MRSSLDFNKHKKNTFSRSLKYRMGPYKHEMAATYVLRGSERGIKK